MRILVVLAVLLLPEISGAAPVFRCVDSAGRSYFTQHGCGDQAPAETLHPKAARPSGAGRSVKLADPAKFAPPAVPRARRTYNHCGELTQVDIAYANNRGEAVLGMTGEDVRRSWGSPKSINRSASGEQWIYPIDEYRNRYVYIDNAGCFTYWN